MAVEKVAEPRVDLLASTPEPYARQRSEERPFATRSFFRSAQWSADGTTLFTSSSSHIVSSYIVPEDLLQPRESPLQLGPQGSLSLPEPSHALASNPYFSLANPYSHLLLTAPVDHPIQMRPAFPPLAEESAPTRDDGSPGTRAPPIASYPLIQPESEAHLPVLSLLWPAPGTHFVAGTKNLLAMFDIERSASGAGIAGPILRLPTIPSARHRAKGGGVGMRGTVSALAAQPGSSSSANLLPLVAAGTWTRCVGLYDLARAGSCVATWSVSGSGTGGGIVQTIWSPCGRYLLVNERKASGLLVYDVRVTGALLVRLEGRDGHTNQRLTCDVFPGSAGEGDGGDGGFEVWAGSRDGSVAVWEGVGRREGGVEPSWSWRAHDEGSAVGSTAMHLSGSVVATCSGSWELTGDASSGIDDSDTASPPAVTVRESTLKIWGIGVGAGAENDKD